MIAFLEKFCGSGEDCPVLGLCDERISDVETNAAKTHHRVNLVEALTSLDYFLNRNLEFVCKLLLLLLGLRNELVERRIEKTEHYRLAVHNAEGALD